MYISFHPQIDIQMERFNQTLETYLRTFINYDKENRYSLLPLAEFAYKNSITQPTTLIPFYTNYGLHPKTVWTWSEELKNLASTA
jgi:aromatic ring hydroxylase